MAPGQGDASMASSLQTPWKTGDLNKVLAELQVSGSIHFHKTLARSQKRKFGQCEQLTLPTWFINENSDKFEGWAILRTRSSSKPWRARLSVAKKPNCGSPHVKFAGGWNMFAAENHLKENDTLVFVLNMDARSEFQVYIFRGTGRSSSTSQTPARKWSNNSNGAKLSEQSEKGTNAGRQNLQSAGDENIRKAGDVLTGKKKAVRGRLQNLGDRFSNLECDHIGQGPSSGCGVELKNGAASEIVTGIECKGFAPQHGANSLPSFRRLIMAYDQKDGRMEIPASFSKTHGMELQARVEVQGIHQESPVRIVTRYWRKQGKQTRLYFQVGWRGFLKENGLQAGQELEFTLTSDSFFVVRVV